MAQPPINVTSVLNALKRRNYRNVQLIYIDRKPCLQMQWTPEEITAFCAEFGVSGHESKSGFIICNLHQPYKPKTRFSAIAA